MLNLKKLFCRHKNSEVVCWHWVHCDNSHGVRILEIQSKCHDCGRYYFWYIYQIDECYRFINMYPDKEWSFTCKPVLK